MENSYLEGDPLHGFALDFATAFDNVLVTITSDLLNKVRLNNRSLTPLTYMYDNLKGHFKNTRTHWRTFQGCKSDYARLSLHVPITECARLNFHEKCTSTGGKCDDTQFR